MTQTFAAVLLVCLASMPKEECTEDTAVDVRSIPVDNELGCTAGWQELIARGPGDLREGAPVYLKTLCRRVEPGRRRVGDGVATLHPRLQSRLRVELSYVNDPPG